MGHRVFLLSLAVALLLLIISTEQHTARHAQATAVTQQGMDSAGVGSMMRSTVGSRPPSCAGRCWWCGGRRCVAVQVPITPQDNKVHSRGGGARASAAQRHKQKKQHHHQQEVSSYDDHSNYKPLSWRCKCGGP
ncbi:unnamed protein product [Urochloa decumbens]|uniref:Epidermal patterning factor-like protein n=1 Tax=Urochloa decumbens TaxID=240449 RepID=A0ABC8VGY9_9POAL